MATTTGQPITDALEDIGIVDCDAHFTEPPSLWGPGAAALTDELRSKRRSTGITAWYLDGEVWASTGGNTIKTGRQKILGSARHPALRERRPRRMGRARAPGPAWTTWASRPRSSIPTGSASPPTTSSPLRTWRSEGHPADVQRLLRRYPGRIRAAACSPRPCLPIWDMDLTVREMNRLLDKGMRGFTLSDKPEMLGLPELPEPYFDPMWDLFNESGAVANFHIGAGARREELGSMRNMRNQPPDDLQRTPPDPGRWCSTYWDSFGSPAPLGRPRHPDVHEQRAHHRQPVHEQPLRPLSEAQDRLGRERHRVGARSSSSRWSTRSTR